jgi:hypothetical protein
MYKCPIEENHSFEEKVIALRARFYVKVKWLSQRTWSNIALSF